MAEDADQTLPSLAFFFTQGATEIGQNEERVRFATLAKYRSAKSPAARASRESFLKSAGGFALQAFEQAQFGSALADEAFGILGHEPFAGAIDQPQTLLAVEGKHCHVDLGHDGGQQGAGLHGSETLFTQHLRKRVDLEHKFAQGIAALGATDAE